MPTDLPGQTQIALRPETLLADLDELFQHADELCASASSHRTFRIAGQSFAVFSDVDDYLDAVDCALASERRSQTQQTRIFVGIAGMNGCPVIRWSAPYFEERRIEAMLAETRYRLHYYQPLSYWQIYDRQTATGMQVMQAPDQYPAWDLGSPLRNFLQWRLASDGGALVHAGTLGVDGKGVLLAGAGGSGKSGTVLSGMLAGLSSVGDDYVFVKRDTLHAYSLFETLKQDENGLRRLGIDKHPAIPRDTNWQNKYQFYMRDLTGTRCTRSLSLHALLLPKIADASDTTFSPVSSKDAFLALAPSGVTQIPGDRPLLYSTAAEISRRLPCYQMHLGSDPVKVSAAIRQFILDL